MLDNEWAVDGTRRCIMVYGVQSQAFDLMVGQGDVSWYMECSPKRFCSSVQNN